MSVPDVGTTIASIANTVQGAELTWEISSQSASQPASRQWGIDDNISSGKWTGSGLINILELCRAWYGRGGGPRMYSAEYVRWR